MRLRTTLIVAFVALAILQVAIVVPLALQNLSALLSQQQETRVDQLMVAVNAEKERLRSDMSRAMDELATSPAMEDAARDEAFGEQRRLLLQLLLRESHRGDIFRERLCVERGRVAREIERRRDHLPLLFGELVGVVLLPTTPPAPLMIGISAAMS